MLGEPQGSPFCVSREVGMIRMGNPLNYVDVPEAEVLDVMKVAGLAVDGRPENTVFLGLLALAIFMRNPAMTGEQLRDGVKGVSEWIAMYTDTLTTVDTPVGMVN